MRFEEPVPHDKVADVWHAALGVQEYEVQLVLADGLVVPLDDVNRVHSLELVDGVQFAQRIPRGLQKAHLTRRASGFGHTVGPAHLGSAKSHCPLFQIDVLPGQRDGLRHPWPRPNHELHHQQLLGAAGVCVEDQVMGDTVVLDHRAVGVGATVQPGAVAVGWDVIAG